MNPWSDWVFGKYFHFLLSKLSSWSLTHLLIFSIPFFYYLESLSWVNCESSWRLLLHPILGAGSHLRRRRSRITADTTSCCQTSIFAWRGTTHTPGRRILKFRSISTAESWPSAIAAGTIAAVINAAAPRCRRRSRFAWRGAAHTPGTLLFEFRRIPTKGRA